ALAQRAVAGLERDDHARDGFLVVGRWSGLCVGVVLGSWWLAACGRVRLHGRTLALRRWAWVRLVAVTRAGSVKPCARRLMAHSRAKASSSCASRVFISFRPFTYR